MSPDDNWYYLQLGVSVGPVTRAVLESMIQAGTIRPDTMVWPGAGDWVAAGTSPLAARFARGGPQPPAYVPPFQPIGAAVAPLTPQNKYEVFVFAELTPHLAPGERFEITALLWTGSMLRLASLGAAAGAFGAIVGGGMAIYFAAATDRRLFLIRTKAGLLALKAANFGLSEVRYEAVRQVSTAGTLHQRTIAIAMRDGSTVNLRLNTMARTMSGQRQFLDRFPQLVVQRHTAVARGA